MTPTYSQLCTVSSSVDIFAEYIQVWDQNSLSYGVRSQAFFDVVSIALKLAPTRDDSFSGLESLTLIALSCDPKLSPAGQQITKHDGLYPFNTLRLVNCASFCWALLQQRNDPCRIGFYTLAFLSFFLQIP